MHGIERDEPIRHSGGKPRAIMERLARDVQPTPTVLDEPGPETNRDPEAQGAPLAAGTVRFGGGAEPVEATRTEPGGVAVVEVPGELAGHTDDDSQVVDGELVERERIAPADSQLVDDERDDGRPVGSPAVPAGGEPDVGAENLSNVEDQGDGGEVSAGSVTGDETVGAADEDDDEAAGSPGGSTARAGTPGTISPPLEPRPGTLLELADAVQPEPSTAWPAGSFVTYGSGKRAHWNGEAWRSGEAPSSS